MKHYVEYYYASGVYSDTPNIIARRDPESIEPGPYTLAFRFFDCDEAGNRSNYSEWFPAREGIRIMKPDEAKEYFSKNPEKDSQAAVAMKHNLQHEDIRVLLYGKKKYTYLFV